VWKKGVTKKMKKKKNKNKIFGHWATVPKTVRPMLSDGCLCVLSVMSVTFLYCGQTVG